MASLIQSLSFSGSRKADGSPNASGLVYLYKAGTTTLTQGYKDDGATQPWEMTAGGAIQLDGAGKLDIWTKEPVDIVVADSSGTQVDSLLGANKFRAEQVEIEHAALTGTLANGSQGAGGKTFFSSALTSLLGSVGGPDFLVLTSSGEVGRHIADEFKDIWINVKRFGAKGDGKTDDTAAIQQAINLAKALAGGVVYFPPGTYLISSSLSLASATGVSFKGAGQAASVLKNTSGATNALTITSCVSFFIEDLGISHSSSSTVSGVSLVSCSQFRIGSLAVTAHQFGIDISGAAVVGSEIRSPNIITTTNANSRAIRYNVSGNSADHVIYGGMLSTGGSGTGIEFNGSIAGVSVLGVEFPVSGSFVGAGCTTGILFNASLTGNLFSVVGCMGLGSNGGFSIGVASDPVLFQFNNGVDGYSVDVTSGGNHTPDRSRGKEIRIRGTTTGVAYTINAPTPVPQARDVYLTLHFFNAAGGAITGWTLNATYHTTGAISTVDTNHTMLMLKWDNDSGVWREICRAVTT